MKQLFILFLLVLIIGSIDAQQFEKIADFKTSETSTTYDLLSGDKNMLITGRDITTFNGVSSTNGLFLFDGSNYVAGSVGDDLCCGNYQVDKRARVYGAVSTGPYRAVFGKLGGYKTEGHFLDSGFIAITLGEDKTEFVKTNICYSSIYDSVNESGAIMSGTAISPTKIFFGGSATTINGKSCPYTFIYDIVSGEVDTLGGREVENGPNLNVAQVLLSPDKSKVVCLDIPNYSRAWHISSYNLKTKTWSKEKELSNIVPYYMWYHRGQLYLSAQFLESDTSCHSNVLQQWARQKSDGSWEYVCLNNDQNKTWYMSDVYSAMDILPDSVMFVGVPYGTATFNDWNDMLHPIPRVDRPDWYETSFAMDTFKNVIYCMAPNRFFKVIGQILPLTWTSFTAVPLKNSVVLNWSVANVSNNDRFEVERSTDSRNFSRVGTVADNGANSYEYVDNYVPYTTLFYRIKQVDKDGKSSYSQTVVVKVGYSNENDSKKLKIYPNPATYGKVTVEGGEGKIIEIVSVLGQKVKTVVKNSATISVDVSVLKNGMYFLKTEKGEVVKLLIQK